jgi:Icc-related predicted phosphoesterase
MLKPRQRAFTPGFFYFFMYNWVKMKKIKILCLSDLHSNQQFLRSLNEHLVSHKYDLVLCAGDVISRPNKKAIDFLKEFINIICNLHQTKLYMVHGNSETEKMIDLMRKKNVLIHLKVKRFRGHKFYGIGGWMEDVPEASKLKAQMSNSILLTHIPPKRPPKAPNGSRVKAIAGGPLIHLCGHLHAPGAIWRIGETLVVKIPSAMYGEAAVLEMPGIKIKFIRL